MLASDGAGTAVYANPAFEQAAGLDTGALAGRPAEDVLEKIRLPKGFPPRTIRLLDASGRTVGRLHAWAPASSLDRVDSPSDDTSLVELVGRSQAMANIFKLIDGLSDSSAPVFIHGERGTGKKTAARAIHRNGPHRDSPLLELTCTDLDPVRFVTALLGNGRCNCGLKPPTVCILLSEAADLSPEMQSLLLRLLETGALDRPGGLDPRQVEIRPIATAGRHITELVADNRFRADLYYRLNTVPVAIPPLRERPEDIPVMAQRFLQEAAAKIDGPPIGLSASAANILSRRPWPGNAAELKSALTFAAFLQPNGELSQANLPPAAVNPQECASCNQADRFCLAVSATTQSIFRKQRAGINPAAT
jgi:DNA-binding NtrC family response regulator